MRALLVGASGAIGRHLIPQLAERGHQVTGTSRSAAKAGRLRSLGAEPAVLDVLDALGLTLRYPSWRTGFPAAYSG
ncbi:MAG TPA: NAD(P)H-binding protein [Trebonia sp.]|jgi:uncharacterized protein YbjT (DUF2867 family)|nr:NAD(P)H-binding protein [Trebonia sp.]